MADNVEQRVTFVQINTDPRTEIGVTEIPLEGQPATDKAFVTDNGTKFRARIIKQTEIEGSAPVREGTILAPSTIVLSLSLALLDDDNNVLCNCANQKMIMDKHEITFTADALKLGLFDVSDAIMRAVRQEAAALEAWHGKQSEIATALDSWGGGSITGELVRASSEGVSLVPIAPDLAAGAGAGEGDGTEATEGSGDAPEAS